MRGADVLLTSSPARALKGNAKDNAAFWVVQFLSTKCPGSVVCSIPAKQYTCTTLCALPQERRVLFARLYKQAASSTMLMLMLHNWLAGLLWWCHMPLLRWRRSSQRCAMLNLQPTCPLLVEHSIMWP